MSEQESLFFIVQSALNRYTVEDERNKANMKQNISVDSLQKHSVCRLLVITRKFKVTYSCYIYK